MILAARNGRAKNPEENQEKRVKKSPSGMTVIPWMTVDVN